MFSLVYIYYAYTGWNGASYLAGEIRDPQRILPRAILIGTGGVLVLYLAVNAVYALAMTPADVQAMVSAPGEQGRAGCGGADRRDRGPAALRAPVVQSAQRGDRPDAAFHLERLFTAGSAGDLRHGQGRPVPGHRGPIDRRAPARRPWPRRCRWA